MLFINLPSEIICNIFPFLRNEDSCSLVNTNKEINSIGNRNGFIRKMVLNYQVDSMDFLRLFCKHSNTIEEVFVENVVDPHVWLPQFVTSVELRCEPPYTQIKDSRTGFKLKKLIFTDYFRQINRKTLKINWKDFKNLEVIELYVYNVDLEGMECLKNLKKVFINTLVYEYQLEGLEKIKALHLRVECPYTSNYILD